MNFNNASLVVAMGENAPNSLDIPHMRRRVKSDPCLPERLPTSAFIEREAGNLAPQELVKQKLKASMEDSLESPSHSLEIDTAVEQQSSSAPSSPRSTSSTVRSFVKSLVSPRSSRAISWSNLEPYEIMRAVEERNIMFLMEVRDKAFPLLLQTTGGETPLVHAIRCGHKDVAIVLLGAFSRWVNYLEDSDVQKPQTQSYLRALRVGLKLAINEGLAKSQSELIASFMQTLIMSEGDKWVWSQISTVSIALNSGSEGKPVEAAASSVRRFATKELGKAELIAAFEDYVANATADLLVLAAWSVALQSIRAEPIPTYYFARDDRVYKAFAERLHQHQNEIQRSCSRRLRWQLQVLKGRLEGRSLTFRRKVELLEAELDHAQDI